MTAKGFKTLEDPESQAQEKFGCNFKDGMGFVFSDFCVRAILSDEEIIGATFKGKRCRRLGV